MIKAVLTDIEGTTTSIRFVHEVLFPYAAARMADFVKVNEQDPAILQALLDVATESGIAPEDTDGLVAQLLQWIDEDRKATPLKTLQGLLWREGYESGDYQGHVYKDVPVALASWQAEGLGLYIYSSGSVGAQKLLFSHTSEGDLTHFFTGYYDTRVGGKKEAASYTVIAADIGLPPSEILFLSDVPAELDAAATAGMRVCQLVRDEAAEPQSDHPSVTTFNEIELAKF